MLRFGHFRKSWERVNSAFQTGISGLLLVMGVVLFVTLLPTLPSTLLGVLSGDLNALYTLIDIIAGVSVCWLQWRYRHFVYPQLRRDSRLLKQGIKQ